MEETDALNDPSDDTILRSLRVAGLTHLIDEVRRVLDSTSNLLVGAWSISRYQTVNPFEPTRFPPKFAPGTAIFQGLHFFVRWHDEFLITAW